MDRWLVVTQKEKPKYQEKYLPHCHFVSPYKVRGLACSKTQYRQCA